MSADASTDNGLDLGLTDAELDSLVGDALTDFVLPEDAELRTLGLVTDCAVCGGRIVQRTFGPARVTCTDACRQRLSRLRRRLLDVVS